MSLEPTPGTPNPFEPAPVVQAPAPAARNTNALIALIAGIVAVVTLIFNWIPVDVIAYISCLSPIAAIIAIITGSLGLSFAKKNNGIDRSKALIGLILGIVFLVIYVLLIGLALVLALSGMA
jgi:small-conductance mechanosensitive channel